MYELPYSMTVSFQGEYSKAQDVDAFSLRKLNQKASLPLYSVGPTVREPTQIQEEET